MTEEKMPKISRWRYDTESHSGDFYPDAKGQFCNNDDHLAQLRYLKERLILTDGTKEMFKEMNHLQILDWFDERDKITIEEIDKELEGGK